MGPARDAGVIRETLNGRRVAITGATGFLGTALVERLLRAVPGSELVLVVRAGRRTTPTQRAKREIFGNDAFTRLRSELGDRFDADIIASFCHYVHFFRSRDDGEAWVAKTPGTFLLTLDEAIELARLKNQAQFGVVR